MAGKSGWVAIYRFSGYFPRRVASSLWNTGNDERNWGKKKGKKKMLNSTCTSTIDVQLSIRLLRGIICHPFFYFSFEKKKKKLDSARHSSQSDFLQFLYIVIGSSYLEK
jgi:hypothetical protein